MRVSKKVLILIEHQTEIVKLEFKLFVLTINFTKLHYFYSFREVKNLNIIFDFNNA